MQRLPILLSSAVLSTLCLAMTSARDRDSDLLATARAAGSFETLLAAVRAAGLEPVLRGAGPFTVLAPTDAAFAALPDGALQRLLEPERRDELVRLLQRHVIDGRVSAAQAAAAGVASSLAGDRLVVELSGGQLRVDGARVVENDIVTSNGVIHSIDRVLVPPAAPRAAADPLALTSATLIDRAIHRGVPLYNGGQPAACAAVYEVAALALLAHSEPALPPDVVEALRAALRLEEPVDPQDYAWRLRRALDAAALALRQNGAAGAAPARFAARAAGLRPHTDVVAIDDFGAAAAAGAWGVVNDTVMGGRSRSALTVREPGVALFSGTVSLANNGGFASTRREVASGSLRGCSGIWLRVRGDGKRYRLSVSDRGRVTGDLYQAEFATRAGEWLELRLPFADMARSVMGFRPPNAAPVDPARIRSIGLGIGDKQAGAFRLEIDAIRAYRPRRL
ncbi:MAG: CIA30 family protein [Planctomycetota bacterium]